SDLKKHIKRIHTADRTVHSCSWLNCTKQYTSADLLRKHVATFHERKRAWKCDKMMEDGTTPCSFATGWGKAVLRKHIQQTHGPDTHLRRKKTEEAFARELKRARVYVRQREFPVPYADLQSE